MGLRGCALLMMESQSWKERHSTSHVKVPTKLQQGRGAKSSLALGKSLERAVLPLWCKAWTEGNALHSRQHSPNADYWKRSYQALGTLQKKKGQKSGGHEICQGTCESGKHMKDKIKFNSAGAEKAGELANLGADLEQGE